MTARHMHVDGRQSQLVNSPRNALRLLGQRALSFNPHKSTRLASHRYNITPRPPLSTSSHEPADFL